MTAQRVELDRLLTGELDQVELNLGGATAQVEAVLDVHQRRHALLMVLARGDPAAGEFANPVQRSSG